MRTTRIELEQAVIRAARELAAADAIPEFQLDADGNIDFEKAGFSANAWLDRLTAAKKEVIAAVTALDEHVPANITGHDVPHNDTDTSRKSAALATFTQGSARMEIVGQLASVTPLAGVGYTDEQLERRLGKSHQTVSSARNWLVKAGWVTDSGVRRRNAGSKRDAIVWTLTPAAQAHLKGLA